MVGLCQLITDCPSLGYSFSWPANDFPQLDVWSRFTSLVLMTHGITHYGYRNYVTSHRRTDLDLLSRDIYSGQINSLRAKLLSLITIPRQLLFVFLRLSAHLVLGIMIEYDRVINIKNSGSNRVYFRNSVITVTVGELSNESQSYKWSTERKLPR